MARLRCSVSRNQRNHCSAIFTSLFQQHRPKADLGPCRKKGPTCPAADRRVGQWGALQAMVPSLGMELTPIDVHDADQIGRAVAAFANSPNSALVVVSTALAATHRELIIKLAAHHRLPAPYPLPLLVAGSGLMSYGPDQIESQLLK